MIASALWSSRPLFRSPFRTPAAAPAASIAASPAASIASSPSPYKRRPRWRRRFKRKAARLRVSPALSVLPASNPSSSVASRDRRMRLTAPSSSRMTASFPYAKTGEVCSVLSFPYVKTKSGIQGCHQWMTASFPYAKTGEFNGSFVINDCHFLMRRQVRQTAPLS